MIERVWLGIETIESFLEIYAIEKLLVGSSGGRDVLLDVAKTRPPVGNKYLGVAPTRIACDLSFGNFSLVT